MAAFGPNAAHDDQVDLGEFTRLALWTVPAALAAATVALWASIRVIGVW